MKDAIGQELVVGCAVVFSRVDSTSTQLGLVTHLTPKGVRIAYAHYWPSGWRLDEITKIGKAVIRIQASTEELNTVIQWIVSAQLNKDIQ